MSISKNSKEILRKKRQRCPNRSIRVRGGELMSWYCFEIYRVRTRRARARSQKLACTRNSSACALESPRRARKLYARALESPRRARKLYARALESLRRARKSVCVRTRKSASRSKIVCARSRKLCAHRLEICARACETDAHVHSAARGDFHQP